MNLSFLLFWDNLWHDKWQMNETMCWLEGYWGKWSWFETCCVIFLWSKCSNLWRQFTNSITFVYSHIESNRVNNKVLKNNALQDACSPLYPTIVKLYNLEHRVLQSSFKQVTCTWFAKDFPHKAWRKNTLWQETCYMDLTPKGQAFPSSVCKLISKVQKNCTQKRGNEGQFLCIEEPWVIHLFGNKVCEFLNILTETPRLRMGEG